MEIGIPAAVMFVTVSVLSVLGWRHAIEGLVRREESCHLDQWERDGRPISQRNPLVNLTSFWHALSSNVTTTQWIVRPPAWIRQDPAAWRLVLIARVCFAAPAVTLIVALIASN